jgi:hypothetical protein
MACDFIGATLGSFSSPQRSGAAAKGRGRVNLLGHSLHVRLEAVIDLAKQRMEFLNVPVDDKMLFSAPPQPADA